MRHPLFTTAVCLGSLGLATPLSASPGDEADRRVDTRVDTRQRQPAPPPSMINNNPLRHPLDPAAAGLPFDNTTRAGSAPDRRPRSFDPLRRLRTIDGSGNHRRDTDRGAAGTLFLRSGDAYYADGIGVMRDGVNSRVVSNALSQQTSPLGNARNLSSMFWQWGQFIDHDFNLTEGGHEFEPIVITSPDPVFEIGAVIPFTRSEHTGGTSVDDPRGYTNGITHWLDGSMVYGSDDERAAALRSFEGGRLATGADGFMIRNTAGLANEDGGFLDTSTQFLAGDVRANEQAGLTAMHEVFVRYHNAWADRLSAEHRGWDDERVYQTARKIVGAQVQSITYDDWLTALLGERAIKRYEGYKPRVDATQSLAFATAAFRLGHTMLNDQLLRYNADGSVYAGGHLGLTDAFFNPDAIASEDALASVLRGLAVQEANEIDTQAVESVRSFLFGDPAVGGLDLIALNIQRGRDHGLGDYNTIREDFGLDRVDSFDDITSNEDLAAALAGVYDGVDDIDPWIGLMAEDHLEGASVGETLAVILIDQFTRMRDGDRFWYQNDPALDPYLREIERTSLADVIALVSDAELTGDVFFAEGLLASAAFDAQGFTAVPEPASLALLVMGGFLVVRRRRG